MAREILDSYGSRICIVTLFVALIYLESTKNLIGIRVLRHALCFLCSHRIKVSRKSLGLEGWALPESDSSLLYKVTSKRRSPWLCPAPSVGAGLFFVLI